VLFDRLEPELAPLSTRLDMMVAPFSLVALAKTDQLRYRLKSELGPSTTFPI